MNVCRTIFNVIAVGAALAANGSILIALLIVPSAYAQDARYSEQQYQQRQRDVVTLVQQDKTAAVQQAAAKQQQLFKDAKLLQQAVREAQRKVALLIKETVALKKKRSTLLTRQKKLAEEKTHSTMQLQELLGFIRVSARDVDALLQHSQLNALDPHRGDILTPLLQQQRFPGMDDVRGLRDLLLAQFRASGEVQIVTMSILDRQGEKISAQTLLLGDFSAAYRSDDETGFLLYSQPSAHLLALSVLPSGRIQRQINAYLDGESDSVPLDIGHGSSLRQLTYRTDLGDQLGQGGFIVWPIMLIGVVALVLILERMWFLRRNSFDATALLQQLQPNIKAQQWDECKALCQHGGDKPLPRVLSSALRFRDFSREDLENVLQEAILGEIPRLERFLSTLAVLASIAPLLGLLGTVTGMINTFQMITFHGTSDPRMMSGGISEALVTTMAGLGVAIPIMLSHSLLSRRVETMIAELEEKSISFVNLVCQSRSGSAEVKK